MKTAVCVFLTVLALAHGWTEEECDGICTANYEPYCLTFQKTVSNECMGDIEICKMRAKGYTLTSSADNRCQCNIGCTMEYKPVCGLDLNTNTTTEYGNACAFRTECNGTRLVEVPMDQC
uniref:Kazal protease inhibitor n=1 Tax=Conus ermineus TaxID=55423 RepID=A0A346CIJ8_CONER|nr:kazal protease inhibitor [Conus ermineus]